MENLRDSVRNLAMIGAALAPFIYLLIVGR